MTNFLKKNENCPFFKFSINEGKFCNGNVCKTTNKLLPGFQGQSSGELIGESPPLWIFFTNIVQNFRRKYKNMNSHFLIHFKIQILLLLHPTKFFVNCAQIEIFAYRFLYYLMCQRHSDYGVCYDVILIMGIEK